MNVLANRKGGGRVGAMAKGPDGKYAVGGGMGERGRPLRDMADD